MVEAATHAYKGCRGKENHDGRIFACHRGCEVKPRNSVVSLRKFSVLFLDFSIFFFFARSPPLPVFKQWSVLTMCKSAFNLAALVDGGEESRSQGCIADPLVGRERARS